MKKIVSLATMLSLLFSLPQSMVAFAEENGEKSAETTVSNPVEKATEANVVVGGGASENTSEKANKETVVEKTTEPIVAETSAPTPSENTVTEPTQPEVVDMLLHTSSNSMSTKIFLKEKIGKDTDWRRTIDLEKTLEGVLFVPKNVKEITPYEAELISISDDTYFVSLRGTTGWKNTTLASSGDLQNKLKVKGGKMWPKIGSDQEKAILDNIDQYFAPSWASSKGFRRYHEIKEGDTVIAYTLQDSTYTWIYASAKKKAEPSQPAEPANLKTFYTSNGKKIDLVMKKDGSLDFDATKEKLQKLLVERADELRNIYENGKTLKEIAEKFAEKATEKDVQIIKINEEEDLLFVNLGTSTKVFFANENSIFKDAFKGGTAGKPNFDKNKIVAPKWTDPQKTLVKYNEVKKDGKLIGYTVKNDAFQWFYVPADTTTPPSAVVTKKFYTSNNNEFAVIMKDDNTVDFEASKKLLADKLDSIANQEAKKLAEDFVKNATDADVEIKKIEGIDILFVKTKDGTKAFAGTPDSIFKDAFKGGTAGKPDFDKDKIVAPQWTKTTKDVIKYNKVGDIGYTLKNSDNDWYFAPKAKPQNKPNNGGGSSGGGSSGGGSSYSGGGSSASSSASKVTPTKTTEVKGDEIVRVFALTGAVNPTITTLDDARLDEFMKKNNIAVADKNIGMTRAEVVKLLAQVTGQKTDSVDVAKLQYVDVGKNTEYAKYIAFATENKIVSGYEDGTFRPNNIISRAELMKVLVNSIGYKLADKQTQFADVEATHTLALYIQTAYNNKIINGVTATTFEPNRAITKGEFAKIIYNILYTK